VGSGPRIIEDDLELFLTGYLRRELPALPGGDYAGGFISNEYYPADPDQPDADPDWQVIVRDDGGPRTGIITSTPSAGITVLGSDNASKDFISALARVVRALVEDCAAVQTGNPVAAVLSSNGPYRVPDPSGHARRYMTFTFSVVGHELA
jgi:hypothetical protein